MLRSKKRISLLLLVSLLLSSLSAPVNTVARIKEPAQPKQQEKDEGNETHLRFRLSQAPDQPETLPTPNVASATLLSDRETANLLSRLPPMEIETGDKEEFALRERSLPPPRTGQTIAVGFPAAENLPPETTASGPLDVTRHSPEGDVSLAPNLSITFSQPMVAVSSQQEVAANVPVKLAPQPPGKWRWIGTRTLLFEPDGRFPMATKYSVTVPAGTRAANGGVLAAGKTWNFSTPPPTVKTTFPDSQYTRERDSLMFIEFDQRIDPAAVLSTIKVLAGQTDLPVRLATREELEADKDVRDLAKDAEKDRWLAFRAVDASGATRLALPADATLKVLIGPGTPSLEGPSVTLSKQEFTFRTFGPLRVTKSHCGYADGRECNPYDLWQIEFSNWLKSDAFEESQVRVEPAIPGQKTSVLGNTLTIQGTKKPNRTYRVTFDKSLRDNFNQTLGRDESVEFKVGAMPSLIKLAGQGFVVLDPAGPRQLSLYTLNYQTVKVNLYAVEPEDWVKYNVYRQLHYRYPPDAAAQKAVLPGRLVDSKHIDLKSSDETVETPIDLSAALTNGRGQVIVAVESITPASDSMHSPLLAWVQATNIGLDAFVDRDELIGWATSLVDGAPLSDVQMQILPSQVSGTSGSEGVAHLTLKQSSDSPPSLLVARRGNDLAILPEYLEYWRSNGSWHHWPPGEELSWYVFDDRKLYRPGEDVHIKGWMRRVGRGKTGDLGAFDGAVQKVNYSVKDRDNNELITGELTVNPFGGFDTAFKLPTNMNLGYARIEFTTHSDSGFDDLHHTHSFQVQEFRRPEFEVIAKTETEAPLFVGGRAEASVTASYFAGGGLQNTEVKWRVTSSPTNFTPPNRDDYTFGKWFPWWQDDADDGQENSEEFTARTDANGRHRLRIDFDSVNPSRPSMVVAEASVTDVNRQTWTSSARMLVHPADLYVGLKTERTFLQQGEPLVVQSIVTDLDGKAMAGREVRMHVALLDWSQVKGEWQQVEANPQDSVVQSAADALQCTFATKEGGTYRITAAISDDRGRTNESELTIWVAGGRRPRREVEEEKVDLIPNRKEYKRGDTAEVLVQAPFYPAEALLTLRRSGILKSERFHMDGPTYTLRVPIEEAWTPNVHVQVDLLGASDREAGTARSSSDNTETVNTGTAGVSPASGQKMAASPSKKVGGTPPQQSGRRLPPAKSIFRFHRWSAN